MCPPAIMGGLKFLAPIILPQLVNRIFGGNNQNQGPKTHQRGLARLDTRAAASGEDLVVEDQETKGEAERTEQAKQATLRKRMGSERLKAKKAPGTEQLTGTVEGSTDTQSGINLGGTTTTAGAY